VATSIEPLRIKVVEPLGDKMDVYAATDHHDHLVARIDAHRGLEPDQTMMVYLNTDRLHFFEPDRPDAAPNESGLNLCLASEKARA